MSATVKLTKRLGLVSYIKFDQQSSSAAASSRENQLKFLFIIDFESTCWEKRSGNPLPEIIEFPVVLLCLQTGDIKSEFHHYVQPTENPKLSPFCKDLTGKIAAQKWEGLHYVCQASLRSRWTKECPWPHACCCTNSGWTQ